MSPWLTVCIPTIGRPGLERTLLSIREQAPPAHVEIIVAADVHDGTYAYQLVGAMALCAKYSARYLAVDGGLHCYGQPQRQEAMRRARGDWLMFSQDDNYLAGGALAAVRFRCGILPAYPKLFRAETTSGSTVWESRQLREGNADADGIVVPNDPEKLGTWALGYSGDFDFLFETVARHGGALVFEDFLIALKQK